MTLVLLIMYREGDAAVGTCTYTYDVTTGAAYSLTAGTTYSVDAAYTYDPCAE